MANDAVLGLIGLAKRAGRLALGDDMTRALCEDGKARCVLVASDAGATALRRAQSAAGKNVPCVVLPYERLTLGGALGRSQVAVCAIGDIGMAASIMQKLAAVDATYAEVAQQLKDKNVRIQSRKGKKKKTVSSSLDDSGANTTN